MGTPGSALGRPKVLQTPLFAPRAGHVPVCEDQAQQTLQHARHLTGQEEYDSSSTGSQVSSSCQ